MALVRWLAVAIVLAAYAPLEAQRMTGAIDDLGPVPPEERFERMILVLSPSQSQQADLETLLADQQDPQSPGYRRWLTPEEYGRRFGISDRDVDTVVSWLRSHGLDIDEIPSGHTAILFSGAASAVESAFHPRLHRYRVNGETHRANSAAPEIPQALAGVVAGIASLHDFHSQPAAAAPQFSSAGIHYLAPADLATIYDTAPLYANSIDGTSRSIAVVARSNIQLADIQAFRKTMGLPANDPAIILNGADPGPVPGAEQMEATLDAEWAGAIAPNAKVKIVVSASTATSDGVALSAQYIVSRNIAPVVTVSFAVCESAGGAAYSMFWANLWNQAAAQGATVLVSSGDSGAAGCDSPGAAAATHAPGINALCGAPTVTCVGGTQLEDLSNPGLYWAPNGAALSYIPESAWNSSGIVPGGTQLWAGGGGESLYVARPAWQTGNAAHRQVPDVSLAASPHDGYLIYVNGGLYAVGGTSAAAPAWAGIMALAGQHNGSNLGNVNPTLYALPAASRVPVFHDIVAGTNSVPGLSGFPAKTGYDQATGLGSPDAFALIQGWNDASVPSLRLSTGTFSGAVVRGGTVSIPVITSVSGGFSSSITLSTAELPKGVTARWTSNTVSAPGSGTVTLALTAAATMTPGQYNIVLRASGGGISQTTFASITVAPFSVTVTRPAVALRAGTATQLAVTIAFAPGFTSAVRLSAGNLPPGVSGGFVPAAVSGGGTRSTALRLGAAATARSAQVTTLITATAGGASITLPVSVSVTGR